MVTTWSGGRPAGAGVAAADGLDGEPGAEACRVADVAAGLAGSGFLLVVAGTEFAYSAAGSDSVPWATASWVLMTAPRALAGPG